MPDLSICIPARNEMFLRQTVEDILENSRADTEIIVVLDGAWADPQLPMHDQVTVLYNPEPVGQRAATNQAARLARGHWIMKADAHCSFSEGFDADLLAKAAGHEDWTLVPLMKNLHAFDRVCAECGHHAYQGPITGTPCEECGKVAYGREMVWKPRRGIENTAFRFDEDLVFKYWGDFKRRQRWENDCAETMSLLGACWMLTKERYFALDICDENFGSWGQQGTEVACKTWLSGGRLVCVRSCWFAHMFRTQGGDFGFPYEQSQSKIDRAREISRALFPADKWEGATRPFQWLIDRFSPVPGFDSGKGVVYYTTNRLPRRLARECRQTISASGLSIASASLKPMEFGRNVVVPGRPSARTMVSQILAALEISEADYVFMCEHDVLYHPSHFDFTPERDDTFYYNVNVWQAILADGKATKVDDRRQVSGLCASRELLVVEYRERLRRIDAGDSPHQIGYEPGTRDGRSAAWRSELPNVDLRHGQNLTVTKRSPGEFRNPQYAAGWVEVPLAEVPGWDSLAALILQAA